MISDRELEHRTNDPGVPQVRRAAFWQELFFRKTGVRIPQPLKVKRKLFTF
jgi:hypothetical protein